MKLYLSLTFAEEALGTPNPDDGAAVAEILGFKVHKFVKQCFAWARR